MCTLALGFHRVKLMQTAIDLAPGIADVSIAKDKITLIHKRNYLDRDIL